MTIPDQRHVCRRCMVALDWKDDVGWMHPLSHQHLTPGVADHQPEPVPADSVLEHRYVCDFCFAPDPGWTFPCKSFEMPDEEYGSADDWAACDACHDVIETGDRNKLVYRVMHHAPTWSKLRGHERQQAEVLLHEFYGKFFAERDGDPYRGESRR